MITDSVEQNALEDQQAIAAQEAAALDNWNDQNLRTVESNSNTPVIEEGDEAEIQNRLTNLQLELGGDIEDLHFVDIESNELVATTSTARTLEETEFPDTSVLSEDMSATNGGYTEAYVSDETPVVSYFIRVGHDEYEEDAALVITHNLEDRSAQFGHSLGEETTSIAVNQEGQIVLDDTFTGEGSDLAITGYVDDVFLREYVDEDGLLETALSGEGADHGGAMAFDNPASPSIQGEPYNFDHDEYVASYHSTEMGWVVLIHTSTDEAYGFVNTVNQYGTYATMGGILLIGLIGAVIGRNTAKSIDRLTDKVAEMEEGNLDVEFDTPRIDNIGRLYDGFASMRDELKLQITEAEEARADAEREREHVQQLNDDLQQAATAYCGVMEEAAEGDLTVRMDPDATDNETMQAIGEDFNEMLTEIEATVESLNQFAAEVATASEEVTASSEEVRSASEQVSESVQEISDGADSQYESLLSVDTEMNNLSTTTEEIAASSNEVADVAERTARTGREGRESAQEAIDACERLDAERQAVVDEFEDLRTEVDQIDELVDRVAEIAEQTNMLALNANIEASRSSGGNEDGGFAAVAAEVKDLSQNVKEATQEIDSRLEGIQQQTERSAEEVEQTSEEIQHVHQLVTETAGALEEIADYAQETNDGVQEISAATEEQAASTSEVVAMVDEVATISEETTTEVENVAAAAEEQTTAMSEVSNSANDLTHRAMALSEALDRFETDASADESFIDLEKVQDRDGDEAFDDAETDAFTFEEPVDETESDEDTTAADTESDQDADASETDDEGTEPAGITEDSGATWSPGNDSNDDSSDDGDDRTFTLDG